MDEYLQYIVDLWEHLSEGERPNHISLIVDGVTIKGVPVTQAVFLAPFKKYENTDLGYLYDTKKITDRGADIAAKFREWIDKPEIRERQKQEKKDFLYLQDENQAIWHIPKSKITAWAIG